ncbi:MAG TPA: hypothetical protein VMV62_01865, partial [Candidatus Paceibacterota bacterium]|nr:hypothetical protein [Candidatus Paceibacterota bacterium]
MRRTLITTSIIVVLLGASVVAYFYLSSGSPTVTVAPTGSASLPVAGQTAPGTTGAGVSTEPSLAPGAPSAPVSVSARLVQISTGPIVPGESVVDMKAASAS